MMKRLFLCLAMVAVLASSQVTMAQGRPQRMNREQRMEQMVKQLNLSDEQCKEFKAVMDSVRPRNNNGERPSREEMEKMRTEMESKIKSILTEEQYQKYQEMHKNKRGGRRNR